MVADLIVPRYLQISVNILIQDKILLQRLFNGIASEACIGHVSEFIKRLKDVDENGTNSWVLQSMEDSYYRIIESYKFPEN